MRYLIPAAVLAALIVLFAVGLQHDPTKIPSPLIDKAAPAFSLPTLDGGTLAIADLRGKTVLINFWASWCTPCLQEHALLLDLAHSGVTIIGVNYKDEPDAANQWLAQHGNPFARIAQDRDGHVAIDWGVYGVPETFVVDGAQVIRHKQIGPMTRQDWDRDIAALVKPVS